MTKLYCSITSLSNILSVTVNASHSASTTVASIETKNNSLNLGDYLEIDLGYTTNHSKIFSGYVKSVEYNVPNNIYTVTANDSLVKALDYYIVSSNPDSPLTYNNKSAESLVESLMALCGLTNFAYDETSFIFGVNNPFEINQVSVYDYTRTICDLLTWHVWCDEDNLVHFKNRKPHVMIDAPPENLQVGWSVDVPIVYTWLDSKTIDIQHHYDEKDLRNRVVIYGTSGIYAEAKNESSPYFHYKTAVLGAGDLIDDQSMAQETADYNLLLFDRITESVRATVIGDPILKTRRTVKVNSTKLSISDEDFYIYGAEHNWSQSGYTTSLELRK